MSNKDPSQIKATPSILNSQKCIPVWRLCLAFFSVCSTEVQSPKSNLSSHITELRSTSFGLLSRLRGSPQLKPKRTLRLWAGLFSPWSCHPVYFENLIEGRFWRVSRASPTGIEAVLGVTPRLVQNYNRMPLGWGSGKEKNQNVIRSLASLPTRSRIERRPQRR
jgi:hypothetical protein